MIILGKQTLIQLLASITTFAYEALSKMREVVLNTMHRATELLGIEIVDALLSCIGSLGVIVPMRSPWKQ